MSCCVAPGSSSCKVKQPCTESDYYEYQTPCDANNKVHWLLICASLWRIILVYNLPHKLARHDVTSCFWSAFIEVHKTAENVASNGFVCIKSNAVSNASSNLSRISVTFLPLDEAIAYRAGVGHCIRVGHGQAETLL